jgi:uncharacterized protein Veg
MGACGWKAWAASFFIIKNQIANKKHFTQDNEKKTYSYLDFLGRDWAILATKASGK